MLTGTRYMYEIVLTGNGLPVWAVRVTGQTEECHNSHATKRYELSLLETKVILFKYSVLTVQ